jgi:anthranilate/para-aminobenzoate synthase component I
VTPTAQHRLAIERALATVRDGDVYEINLARRFAGAFSRRGAWACFLAMRRLSPVPLGYFHAAGTHSVLGRSMERFLR